MLLDNNNENIHPNYPVSIRELPKAMNIADPYLQKLPEAQIENAIDNVFAFLGEQQVLFVKPKYDIAAISQNEVKGNRVSVESCLPIQLRPEYAGKAFVNNSVVVAYLEDGQPIQARYTDEAENSLVSNGFKFESNSAYVPNSFDGDPLAMAAMTNEYIPGYFADRYDENMKDTPRTDLNQGDEMANEMDFQGSRMDYLSKLESIYFVENDVPNEYGEKTGYLIWNDISKRRR